MKKTLIAVACTVFISNGAIAHPVYHHVPHPQNVHPVHMVNHAPKPAHVVVHHHHVAPAPIVVHHNHNYDAGAALLGDVIIAFAILASNAM